MKIGGFEAAFLTLKLSVYCIQYSTRITRVFTRASLKLRQMIGRSFWLQKFVSFLETRETTEFQSKNFSLGNSDPFLMLFFK